MSQGVWGAWDGLFNNDVRNTGYLYGEKLSFVPTSFLTQKQMSNGAEDSMKRKEVEEGRMEGGKNGGTKRSRSRGREEKN